MNCTWGVTERCQGCHEGLGQSKDRLRYGGLREEQVWIGAGKSFGHRKCAVQTSKCGAWVQGEVWAGGQHRYSSAVGTAEISRACRLRPKGTEALEVKETRGASREDKAEHSP